MIIKYVKNNFLIKFYFQNFFFIFQFIYIFFNNKNIFNYNFFHQLMKGSSEAFTGLGNSVESGYVEKFVVSPLDLTTGL